MAVAAAAELAQLAARVADAEAELAQVRERRVALSAVLDAASADGSGAPERIRMQGTLEKLAPPSGEGERGYGVRWFVLAGRLLRYFEHKGTIALAADGAPAASAAEDPESLVLLDREAQYRFELRAPSSEDRERWLAGLLGRAQPHGPGPTAATEELCRRMVAEQECAARAGIARWETSEQGARGGTGTQTAAVQAAQARIAGAAADREAARRAARADEAAASARAARLRGSAAAQDGRRRAGREAAAGKLHHDARMLAAHVCWDRLARWRALRRRMRLAERVHRAQRAERSAAGNLRAAETALAAAEAERLAALRGAAVAEEAAERSAARQEEAELRGHLRLWGVSARRDIESAELVAEAAALTDEGRQLRSHLGEARGDAAEAQQGTRVRGLMAQGVRLLSQEARCRQQIAAQALPGWVAAAAASLHAASEQRSVGRILSCLSSWQGGLPWRWLYLWVDYAASCIWYATRDPRFGEVESIPFHSIWAVRPEELGELCDDTMLPGGAAQADSCGFAAAMSDGCVSRFVAATTRERDEWVHTFATCAAAATAQQMRAAAAAAAADAGAPAGGPLSPSGAPLPPSPQRPGGSHWAALPGGGNPAAAAAGTFVPGSMRRTRRREPPGCSWARDPGSLRRQVVGGVAAAPRSPASPRQPGR
eukprot:TRINITY_DN18913_c0_g2_i1.p1 TRINITY_DN18913_c0_g2~~TRINITY_DN18913_c0_g2_i1.p1  ORF type:complete len:691 (+),score=204.53 TRINITY_DN18913_c0_g2_i1:99-2075(+)